MFPALRRSLAGFAVAAALLVAGAAGSPAWADAPPEPPPLTEQERDREAEAIARTVMSPFCPGRTVSSCPNAGPWRDDIRKWVGEGVPAAEIRRRLYDRVPETNLTGIPPNRLGWFLPIGAALLAVGALVVALRFLLKPSKPGENTTANSGAEGGNKPAKTKEDYDARLDEELETLEQP
jgi:cytochrome c-type biogenesis protein CcmH/NrfF